MIYHRKYDRLYHVKVISYFHARVAQGWSTTLPRWGPRVRIPSRALFIFSRRTALPVLRPFVSLRFKAYIQNGKAPHTGQPSHFYILFLIAGPASRLLPLLFDRIKIFHDSHMYGPGHPVLVFLILQTFGFFSIAQESAFHYNDRRSFT